MAYVAASFASLPSSGVALFFNPFPFLVPSFLSYGEFGSRCAVIPLAALWCSPAESATGSSRIESDGLAVESLIQFQARKPLGLDVQLSFEFGEVHILLDDKPNQSCFFLRFELRNNGIDSSNDP